MIRSHTIFIRWSISPVVVATGSIPLALKIIKTAIWKNTYFIGWQFLN
jgi:hypothetical protein